MLRLHARRSSRLAAAAAAVALLMAGAEHHTSAANRLPLGPANGSVMQAAGAGHVGSWWLDGANMPWLSWNADFGGAGGNVANNLAEVDIKLSSAQAAGMHQIRWWVFEGGSPQISRDGAGTPTGLDPAVYTDIDAALVEAAKYGISYNFVLFGSTNDDAVTHLWWEDAAKRAALTQVLSPLFAHYANNPRIHTWEIVNEPEWQSRNGITSVAGMLSTVDLLANAVHANSSALVTVGQAQIQDMATWVGHPLDYHSPHYYDPFGTGSNDPFVNQVASPDGKPVVIGEFPASSGMTPTAQQRWQALYQNGYAGGWAWSISPEHTNDRIAIDLTAATAFAAGKADLGPVIGLPPPPPTPCTGATLSANPPSGSSAAQVTWTASATGCPNPRYRFWELDPGSRWSMVRDYTPSSTFLWTVPAPAGTYKFEVDVRDATENTSYDVVANVDFQRPGATCGSAGLTASPGSPGPTGATVTLTGASTGCASARYRFWLQDPGRRWSMVQDYSAATTYTWTQTGLAGSYNAEVDVRDASESVVYDSVANITYVVTGCSAAAISANPANTATHGTTITLTGTSTCPGTPTYKFWIKAPGGSWQVVQQYGAANTFAWTPATAGTYALEVDVRDQGGTDTYEKVANLSYVVT